MAISLEATCYGFNVRSSPLAQGCHVAEQEALRRRLVRGAAESSSSCFPSSSSTPASSSSSSSSCTRRWLLSLSSPSSCCSLSLEDRSLSSIGKHRSLIIGKPPSSPSTPGGATAGSASDATCALRSLARGVRRKRRLGHTTTGATVCLALSVPFTDYYYGARRAGPAMAETKRNVMMLWHEGKQQQQRYQQQQVEDGECTFLEGSKKKREMDERRPRVGRGGGRGGALFGGGGGQMAQGRRAGYRFRTAVKTRCAASDAAAAAIGGSETAGVGKSAASAAAAAAAETATATADGSVSLSSAAATTVLKVPEEKEAARPSSSPSTPSRRRIGVGSRLIGCGSAVPSCVISNDDLSLVIDTSDEWIMSRTGIRRRRILSGEESLTGLAVESSRRALEMANVAAADVDLVLLCTSTPEDMFGSACKVQAALGATKSIAFDITAACSGFVLGLVTATRFIRGGGYKNVLVVGADALSHYVDWTDRGTCILFGDGSGAVVVQAAEDGSDGLLGFDLRSDGQGGRHLKLPILTGRGVNGSSEDGVGGGGGEGEGGGGGIEVGKQEDHHKSLNGIDLFPSPSDLRCKSLEMNGRDVFRFAVRAVPEALQAAMEEAGLTPGLIDWLLLHQANQRILDSVAATLHIPQERVISNLVDYGNTSAASIPLALDEAVRSGQIKPGHVVATAGFGAGLTWASAIIRWG